MTCSDDEDAAGSDLVEGPQGLVVSDRGEEGVLQQLRR